MYIRLLRIDGSMLDVYIDIFFFATSDRRGGEVRWHEHINTEEIIDLFSLQLILW